MIPGPTRDSGSALDPLQEFFGHEWFAEHFVRDLEDFADKLRSVADHIDGKAALLHEQMLLANSSAILSERSEHRDEHNKPYQIPSKSEAASRG